MLFRTSSSEFENGTQANEDHIMQNDKKVRLVVLGTKCGHLQTAEKY